jgi:hypothetical protein
MANIQYKELFNISLIIKNDPYDDDGFDSGTYKIDLQNSFYFFKGDNMIIETKEEDGVTGQVFNLKTIKSYKICQ